MPDFTRKRGDTFTINTQAYQPDGVTVMSLVNCTLWFTLKDSIDTAADDSGALVAFSWKAGNAPNGITVTTPSSGLAVVKVPAATMAALIPGHVYNYDFQLLDAAGEFTTMEEGTVRIAPDVTIRTTTP